MLDWVGLYVCIRVTTKLKHRETNFTIIHKAQRMIKIFPKKWKTKKVNYKKQTEREIKRKFRKMLLFAHFTYTLNGIWMYGMYYYMLVDGLRDISKSHNIWIRCQTKLRKVYFNPCCHCALLPSPVFMLGVEGLEGAVDFHNQHQKWVQQREIGIIRLPTTKINPLNS